MFWGNEEKCHQPERLQNMVEHYINAFSLETPQARWEDDGTLISPDTGAHPYFTQKLANLAARGEQSEQILINYAGLHGGYCNYWKNLEYMSPEWKHGIGDWMRWKYNKCLEAGYRPEQIYWILIDEPAGVSAQRTTEIGRWLRGEVIPDIRLAVTIGVNATLNDLQLMDEVVDLWCQTMCYYEREDIWRFLRSTGEPIILFGPYMDGHSWCEAYVHYRLQPWRVFATNSDGAGFHLYDGYNWTPPRTMIWPEEEFEGESYTVTTRRWESMREGWEDYLYLYLLRQAIEQGRGSKTERTEARRLLDELPAYVLAERTPNALMKARRQVLEALAGLSRSYGGT